MTNVMPAHAAILLASVLRNYLMRKEAEKLEAERNAAAFGAEVVNPVKISTPVGAGK